MTSDHRPSPSPVPAGYGCAVRLCEACRPKPQPWDKPVPPLGGVRYPLPRGECREGYIKALRADHKLNISLSPPGYAKIDAAAQNLLNVLKKRGGFLPVTDKSQPEAIYALFGISKKVFKQTLGALYKARRILIEADGIRLVDEK